MPSAARACALVARREARQVDAAVDDLGLRAGLGQLALSSSRSQPDTATTAATADGGDVARRIAWCSATLRTSRPCAVSTSGARAATEAARGDDPGGQQVVRVDDVGPAAHGVAQRVDGRAALLGLRAAPVVDDRGQDLVAAPAAGRRRPARRRRRSRGPPAPATSRRRGGSAPRQRTAAWPERAQPHRAALLARRMPLDLVDERGERRGVGPPRPSSAAGAGAMLRDARPHLLAQALPGADEHLVHRLAGPHAHDVEVGLCAAARAAPDARRELAHGEHGGIRRGQQARAGKDRLADERRCVGHRDPVAQHPRVGHRERDAGAGLAEEQLRCAAAAAQHVHEPDGGPARSGALSRDARRGPP